MADQHRKPGPSKDESLDAVMKAVRNQWGALVEYNKVQKENTDQKAIQRAADVYAAAMAKASVAQEAYKDAHGEAVDFALTEFGQLKLANSTSAPSISVGAQQLGSTAEEATANKEARSKVTSKFVVNSPSISMIPRGKKQLNDSLIGNQKEVENRSIEPEIKASGRQSEMIIMLEGVRRIPTMLKAFYRMDPSIRMFITDAEGKRRSTVVNWPARVNTTDPIWNAPRRLVLKSSKEKIQKGYLHVHLMLPNAGKVGASAVSLNVLTVGHTVGSALSPLLDPEVCTVSFKRIAPPKKKDKYLFLLRHAESEWNWAKANKSLTTLVSQVDHPLTSYGLQQSRRLRERLSALLENWEMESSIGETSISTSHKNSAPLSGQMSTRKSRTSTAPLPKIETPPQSPSLDSSPPMPSELPPPPPLSKGTSVQTRSKPTTRRIPSTPHSDRQNMSQPSHGASEKWEVVDAVATKAHPDKGGARSIVAPPKEFLDRLREAEGVFCSPLTRAIQTCLIALGSHPMWAISRRRRVRLLSSIREKRGWCSLDTQGRDAGVTLLRRLARLMGDKCDRRFGGRKSLVPTDVKSGTPHQTEQSSKDSEKSEDSVKPTEMAASITETETSQSAASQESTATKKDVLPPEGKRRSNRGAWEGWLLNRVDVNDCTDKWWNTSKETSQALSMRMNEFVNLMRYIPEESVIVVGHSAFFREFVQTFSTPELKKRKNELVMGKLQNCEMRGLRFNIEKKAIEDIVSIAKA
mmetsp:Transcript_34324/g.83081  ORF Transcript_34324/g.83081 Transcript_34324/m.83081 type:complete len:750 (-) Transcript_34324:199-2448(-)